MSILYVKMALGTKVPADLKLTLLILSEAADKDGYCWPGLRLISEKSGLCERNVRLAIAALENISLVRRVPRQTKNGASTSTGYYIFPSSSKACNSASQEFDAIKHRKTMTLNNCTDGHKKNDPSLLHDFVSEHVNKMRAILSTKKR